MAITQKQNKILVYVYEHKQISKQKAVELIGHMYYTNEAFHVGNVLSRMVKDGMLRRVKRGLFELGNGGSKQINGFQNPDQTKLF